MPSTAYSDGDVAASLSHTDVSFRCCCYVLGVLHLNELSGYAVLVRYFHGFKATVNLCIDTVFGTLPHRARPFANS